MIGEHANDGLVRGRLVAGERGEQDLLLVPEVLPALGRPELEEGVTGGGRRLRAGAAEALGHEERLMMVARQMGEGFAALHSARTFSHPGGMIASLNSY